MTRRGLVVEAGRATTVTGMVFAEFARAAEGGDPYEPRLVGTGVEPKRGWTGRQHRRAAQPKQPPAQT